MMSCTWARLGGTASALPTCKHWRLRKALVPAEGQRRSTSLHHHDSADGEKPHNYKPPRNQGNRCPRGPSGAGPFSGCQGLGFPLSRDSFCTGTLVTLEVGLMVDSKNQDPLPPPA